MSYYKVVRPSLYSGKLYSSYAKGKAKVEYEVGKLSTPPDWLMSKGYGLTVFDSLKAAMDYSSTYPIYLVAIVGTAREPEPLCSDAYLQTGMLVLRNWGKFPNGTRMVDGVILMREVTQAERIAAKERMK